MRALFLACPALSAVLLAGCVDNSKVPEGALVYDVDVTGIGPDSCHPGSTEGWADSFQYAIALDGSSADVYSDGEPMAAGTISGCNLSYQTVVIGDDGRAGGAIKWQLTGVARIESDSSGDACVDGDAEWEGTETITVIASEDEAIEVGCTYPMSTVGQFVPAGD